MYEAVGKADLSPLPLSKIKWLSDGKSPRYEWFKDKAALECLREAYPDTKAGTLSTWASELHVFANEIHEGDIVVMPCKGKDHVFIGWVDGEYFFGSDPEFRHSRPVKWNKKQVPRDVFKQDLRKSFNAAQTVTR